MTPPMTVVSICATEQIFLIAIDRTLVLRYNNYTNLTIEYQHISVQQNRCRQKTTSRELPYATTSKERAIRYVKAVGETQRVVSRMTNNT